MPNILITGGSGGIGGALAAAYAAPGTQLALWGRRQDRLDAAAEECRRRGATVDTSVFDLRDIDQTLRALEELDGRMPLDIAIFNAGVGGEAPVEALSEPTARVVEMALTNFASPAAGAAAVGEFMARRGRGNIVLIGSVAASFPLPMSPSYSGAKAGLAVFAQALDTRLSSHGVRVTLVEPGFVDTEMSRSLPRSRPFLISAEATARSIVRSVKRRRRHVIVPLPYALISLLPRILPASLVRAVLRRLHAQASARKHR